MNQTPDRDLGVVTVKGPLSYAVEQQVGALKQLSVNQGIAMLSCPPSPGDKQGAVVTLSASFEVRYEADVKPTDDFGGLFFTIIYGVGGVTEAVELDAGTGLFITAPVAGFSLAATYGQVAPTTSNPTPTYPQVNVRAMAVVGTRPSAPTSPTRSRRFSLVNAGTSGALLVPRLARSLHMLGTQTNYSVAFYSDTTGTSLLTTLTIGTTLASLVTIPSNAQSFKVTTAGPAEDVVYAVFQLAL